MPLEPFQRRVISVLASQRSADSYVAGGVPIAAVTPRYSLDLDIFHDDAGDAEHAADNDARTLADAGIAFNWTRRRTGFHTGIAESGDDKLRLEWAHDTAWRFMPTYRHPLFGHVLDVADLAVNKLLALAGRREARDLLDVAHLSKIVPLTAGIIAVPSKDPGYSPFSLIEQLRRNLAHPQAAFDAIASAEPIDAGSLIKGLRAGLDRAEREIEKMPPSAIGFLYRDKGRVVTPTQDNIQSLVELAPSRRGVLGEPHAVRMADAQTALGWQADIGDQGR